MSENKKTLWSKPLFRWCVYVTPLVVFGILSEAGSFDSGSPLWFLGHPLGVSWEFGDARLGSYSTVFWILIFALPAVWVWRKPLKKHLLRVTSFLNRVADDDSK